MLWVLWSTTTFAGWDRQIVDEEVVTATEPHEERSSTYHTAFQLDGPVVLATTTIEHTCRRWSTETVQVTPVRLEKKLKGGEVVKERRTALGASRQHQRNTAEITEPCGSEPAAGAVATILGSRFSVDAQGQWQLRPDSLRQDQLVRVARGVSFEVTGPVDTVAEPFPEAVRRWASGSRGERTEAAADQVARDEAARREAQARSLTALPDQIRAYDGPWTVNQQLDPVSDRLEVVMSRPAASRGPRGLHPELVAQCAGGQLDLYVQVGEAIAHRPTKGEEATVVLRLDDEPAKSVHGTLTADRRTVVLPSSRELLTALPTARTLLFRYTPYGRQAHVDVRFDLTGADLVRDFVTTACPE